MAVTMLVSGITITAVKEAKAEAETWESTAIVAPAEGKLIGAGYINVVFDATVEGAKTYQVFFDGKPVYEKDGQVVRTELGETADGAVERKYNAADCGSKVTCEVYTTKVTAHTASVVATLSDGTTKTTDTRTFYVSKKGIALGSDMTDKITMKDLNVAWYYNWGTDPIGTHVDEGVDHVPMMWGGAEDNIEAMETFTTESNYFLGFNEPDIKSQANMNFWDATKVWTEYVTPLNVRKVSPAPAAPGGGSDWLKKFMFGDYICLNNYLNDGSWGLYKDYEDEASKTWVEGVNDDVDAVVLHYYQGKIDLEGLKKAVNNLWTTYHKPVWITEVSVAGMKGASNDFSYEIPERRAEMAEFVKGIVEYCNDLPYVERYCWFSYNVQSANDLDGITGSGATAMFDYETGNYTELGRVYSQIGNPEGYKANEITDDMMYVYVAPPTTEPVVTTTVPETTKAPETTKVEVTTTVPTAVETTPAPVNKKPGKVTISSAKNVKKQSVSLVWKKVNGAKKYTVQWTTDKKFKKSVKTKTIKVLTIKITKLAKKKTYFFRVKAVDGKNSGNWSAVKKVTIKK